MVAVNPSNSVSTPTKSIPCLRRFSSRLASSHSTCTKESVVIPCNYVKVLACAPLELGQSAGRRGLAAGPNRGPLKVTRHWGKRTPGDVNSLRARHGSKSGCMAAGGGEGAEQQEGDQRGAAETQAPGPAGGLVVEGGEVVAGRRLEAEEGAVDTQQRGGAAIERRRPAPGEGDARPHVPAGGRGDVDVEAVG